MMGRDLLVILALAAVVSGCKRRDFEEQKADDTDTGVERIPDTDTDADTDSDTDADTDADSDTDTDTDTDADTDTGGPSIWMEGPMTTAFCAGSGQIGSGSLTARVCFAPADLSVGDLGTDWQGGPIYSLAP